MTDVPANLNPQNDYSEGVFNDLKGMAEGQTQWYWGETLYFEKMMTYSWWVGILTGLSATILAALPDAVFSKEQVVVAGLIKWCVVILTAISTLVNGTITPRYRRLAEAREAGRIKSVKQVKIADIARLPELERARATKLLNDLMDIEVIHGGVDRPPEPSQNVEAPKVASNN